MPGPCRTNAGFGWVEIVLSPEAKKRLDLPKSENLHGRTCPPAPDGLFSKCTRVILSAGGQL